jgi:uncharacterized protein YggE
MSRWFWTGPLAAVLVLACAAPAHCQRTLSVNVTGVVSAMPDLLFVQLRAVSRNTEVATAQKEHDAILTKVREALANAGVKDDEIGAAGFSVDPITTNYGSGREYRILGHEVSTVLTIMLPFDADKPDAARERVMKLLAAASEAGAEPGVPSRHGGDRFDCMNYGVRDPKPYRQVALERGLAEVEPTAQQMAGRLGLTIMGIQNVSYSFETRGPGGGSISLMAEQAMVQRGGYSSRYSGPQPVEFRAQVNATYLIE